MIKRLILCAAMLSPLFTMAQVASLSSGKDVLEIPRLELKKRQTYSFSGRDSVMSIVIDTLVMSDKSALSFLNKKDVKLLVKHALIGKDCVIGGSDGKNNGTNLILSANFAGLKSLRINVPGLDAKMANRRYDNGNGGKVMINYLSGGIKPQLEDSRSNAYVEINNGAGGYLTNANTDLYNVYSRLNSGVPGRPLSQLPQGRVYSGGTGREGKSDLKEVAELPSSTGTIDSKTKSF